MAQAARKLTAKDTNEKLAHRRLTVLELAQRLGNVAEACRRGGIDRTSFYDWKRRFQLHGLDGLLQTAVTEDMLGQIEADGRKLHRGWLP